MVGKWVCLICESRANGQERECCNGCGGAKKPEAPAASWRASVQELVPQPHSCGDPHIWQACFTCAGPDGAWVAEDGLGMWGLWEAPPGTEVIPPAGVVLDGTRAEVLLAGEGRHLQWLPPKSDLSAYSRRRAAGIRSGQPTWASCTTRPMVAGAAGAWVAETAFIWNLIWKPPGTEIVSPDSAVLRGTRNTVMVDQQELTLQWIPPGGNLDAYCARRVDALHLEREWYHERRPAVHPSAHMLRDGQCIMYPYQPPTSGETASPVTPPLDIDNGKGGGKDGAGKGGGKGGYVKPVFGHFDNRKGGAV